MKKPLQNVLCFSKVQRVTLFIICLMYFGIRVLYWTTTKETPFSDIADYVRIGLQVVERWDFAHTHPFWLSYKPPTLPIIIAFYYKLRGSFTLDLWPFFQTTFNFFALLFLAKKIFDVTKITVIPIFLIFVVSFSTSSVFWSLKPATEFFSETFLFFLCAYSIHSFQRKTLFSFFFLGIVSMVAIFLRPQFLPVLIVIPLGIPFVLDTKRKRFLLACFFVFGAFLTWLPWGYRTYSLYGHPIFTSTQGPYSFLWELGKIKVQTKSGEIISTDINQLQIDAPLNFKNDFDAMKYANEISGLWLHQNFAHYIELIPFRIYNSIVDKSEHLTTVPRNELLPPWFDWILLDKVPIVVITGILGLFLSLLIWPKLWPVTILPISQWGLGVAFLSYPRIIDPALPLFYFGNILFFLSIKHLSQRRRNNLLATNKTFL